MTVSRILRERHNTRAAVDGEVTLCILGHSTISKREGITARTTRRTHNCRAGRYTCRRRQTRIVGRHISINRTRKIRCRNTDYQLSLRLVAVSILDRVIERVRDIRRLITISNIGVRTVRVQRQRTVITGNRIARTTRATGTRTNVNNTPGSRHAAIATISTKVIVRRYVTADRRTRVNTHRIIGRRGNSIGDICPKGDASCIPVRIGNNNRYRIHTFSGIFTAP